MSFRREENLPMYPLTDFPLYLSEASHMPIHPLYHSVAEKNGVSHDHPKVLGRDSPSLLTVPCQISGQNCGSVSKEKAGRGGSRVAVDEVDSL